MTNKMLFRSLLCLLSLFSFSSLTLVAQKGELLLTNSKEIEVDRYEDIQGSPYLFDSWIPGSITNMEAAITEVAEVNYNAHTHLFEIKKDQQYIELDPTWYIQVFLHPTDSDVLTFQKAFHAELPPTFMQLLYQGTEAQLFKQVEKTISKKVFQDVGKTRTVKRFFEKTTYALIQDGQLYQFRLNKKSILKALGQKKAIESFLKENKLKLNSEEALLKVVTFYEGL